MNFLGIHWAGYNFIITLPIFIVLALGLIKNYYRIKHAFLQLVHPNHQKTLFTNLSLPRQRIKTTLLCLSLLTMFTALLQPQWGIKEQIVAQEGRDVLIVLDISKSMMAKDFKPSRLDFAKLKIRTLLKHLTCERVGLIVFAGSAFTVCPLTSDLSAFLMFLKNIDCESIASGTTNLSAALNKVVDVFKTTPDRKHKLALVMTDGEDFSVTLDTVKSSMVKENITLMTWGMAAQEGAPIPKFDRHGNQEGHFTDEKGAIVLSKLNEKELTEISSALQGKYFSASYDDDDIDNIIHTITGYEKEQFSEKKVSHYHDQYPWFLTMSLIFLALEWMI